MIEDAVAQQASHNILIYEELKNVLSAFRRCGIKVIILKGAALLESVYSHIGQRKMGDVDLLVKEKDLLKAENELMKQGYRLLYKSKWLYLKYYGAIQFAMHLYHKIPYLKDKSIIWQKALALKIVGEDALIMSPEENIIYLSYHLAVQHGEPHGKWIEDIDTLLRHYKGDIDWQKLIKKIKSYKLDIPCYYTLRKVKDDFNTPVPDSVLAEIKPANSLKAKVFKLVFQEKKPIPSISYFLEVLIQPRLLFSSSFPSLKFLQIRYKVNPPLAYLYYIIRPITLFLEGIKAVGRLLWRVVNTTG